MTSAANAGMPEQGCGDRLRQAREKAGLKVADVAARMRVPVRVVESLEAEDWERLGAPVFVRGQVRSYARILGLPADALPTARTAVPIEPPRLEPRTFTPRIRLFAEQAARRMVYVVITAAIAVPVWMVAREHVDGGTQETAPLDVVIDNGAGSGELQHPPPRQRPLVASMTPIQARSTPPSARPTAPALSLRFIDDSWVEIMAQDGSQIEQALVGAGQQRSYASGEVGRVVLGNASAVEVRQYGDIQDTAPYRRANVARFTVSSDGSLAPVAE